MCNSAWTSGFKLRSWVTIWGRASRFGSFLWNFLTFSFEISRPLDEVIPDSNERQRPLWLQTSPSDWVGSRLAWQWVQACLWIHKSLLIVTFLQRDPESWVKHSYLLPTWGSWWPRKPKPIFYLLTQHGTVCSPVVMLWKVIQSEMRLPLPLVIISI